MSALRKLITSWMLVLAGNILLPLMSLAAVSGTIYATLSTPTTTPATIAQHAASIETVRGGETSLQSMTGGQARSLLNLSGSFLAAKTTPMPRLPGATVDPLTGQPVGRFIGSQNGPPMIEPLGGRTVAAGRGGIDTHTLYPNGANYQRLNPVGHPNNPTPHAHGHAPGTGPGMRGQGPSLDTSGNIVPWNSPAAHWPFP